MFELSEPASITTLEGYPVRAMLLVIMATIPCEANRLAQLEQVFS